MSNLFDLGQEIFFPWRNHFSEAMAVSRVKCNTSLSEWSATVICVGAGSRKAEVFFLTKGIENDGNKPNTLRNRIFV
jgi:hypothetical protein